MKWQKYLENVDKNWTSTQNIFLDFVLYATYEKYKHEIHFGCYCDEVDKLIWGREKKIEVIHEEYLYGLYRVKMHF